MMDPEKKASPQEAEAQGSRRVDGKKPYSKPALRRLGTVRELTHGHPSQPGVK